MGRADDGLVAGQEELDFVGVVQGEGGTRDVGAIGDVPDGDGLVAPLADQLDQGPLQQRARAPHPPIGLPHRICFAMWQRWFIPRHMTRGLPIFW